LSGIGWGSSEKNVGGLVMVVGALDWVRLDRSAVVVGHLGGGSEKSVGGLAVAVGGLGKLASVFTVGGLCVDGCRMIWSVAVSPAVSLALDALSRCELQRAAAEVLPTCNGLLEWRRA